MISPAGDAGVPRSFREPALRNLAIGLLVVSPLLVFLFTMYQPRSVDWYRLFAYVGRHPWDPYQIRLFFNPPWFALPLSVFAWLPLQVGQAVNTFLNLAVTALVVVRYRGHRGSLLLALTSLPFCTLVIYGNVEWIPMSAFLLPAAWGLPWLLTKPQSGALAGLLWFKRAQNKALFLLPLAVVFALSLWIWKGWPMQALANVSQSSPSPFAGESNAAPWPWLIPLGLLLLYLAWKRDDVLLAVGATLCLSPYYVIHSATLGFALLAARSPRWGLVVWLVLWAAAILLSVLHLP